VFNVTGTELVIILLVALIVLGPEKLPGAVRKFGQVYGELRRMSQGFQTELRDALDEPLREVRDTMNSVTSGFNADDGTKPDDDGGRLAGPVSPAEHEAAAASARAAGAELPTAPVADDDVRMAAEQPTASAEPAEGEPPPPADRA
jgi:sec-independent protein translocase protein TatB